MEEPTPVCSFFTNKYNQLQNQDNPSSSSGLQLSPRCQLKIGLFISFLTLSASFEVLLASSMGKSAFPNDSAVSDFLTKPLSKGHEHFTNGTVLGAVGFVLLLAIFIYFYRKIHEKKTEQVDPVLACRPKNAHKHFLECLMQPE